MHISYFMKVKVVPYEKECTENVLGFLPSYFCFISVLPEHFYGWKCYYLLVMILMPEKLGCISK